MKRYIANARWCDELGEEVADPSPVHVFEPGNEPVFTGLYDAQGNPLYAIEEREPIGFKVQA